MRRAYTSHATRYGRAGWTARDWQVLQRGGWALDVAYHVAATLPVEAAEVHEWDLPDGYLEEARRLGVPVPDGEAARTQYRPAAVYGFYLWAITMRVGPTITKVFVDRLGKAVERNDSYAVVGM